eukprot:gene10087-biopygen4227
MDHASHDPIIILLLQSWDGSRLSQPNRTRAAQLRGAARAAARAAAVTQPLPAGSSAAVTGGGRGPVPRAGIVGCRLRLRVFVVVRGPSLVVRRLTRAGEARRPRCRRNRNPPRIPVIAVSEFSGRRLLAVRGMAGSSSEPGPGKTGKPENQMQFKPETTGSSLNWNLVKLGLQFKTEHRENGFDPRKTGNRKQLDQIGGPDRLADPV